MKMRSFALVLALAALVALALPATAMANFAIHGNYVSDTDACAGCHRAHTSISSITWSDVANNQHSALLVSSATQMWQFCYACHDATGQGADTNVEQGIYEGTLYGTQGAILNGGGFESLDVTLTTSTHMMRGASWGAYGGGYTGLGQAGANGQIPGADVGESVPIKMDCATCHDPHGSPNYRILKSYVNGNYVGGYQASASPTDPNPDGYVSSVETGWPTNGFRLHQSYPAYRPNYTTPLYAKGYNQGQATLANGATGLNAVKGMSGWCAGCHSTYLRPVEQFTKSNGTTYLASASIYNAGDGGGLKLRHRHPINVELSTYNAGDKASMVITDSVLPLAHSIDETQGAPWNRDGDWIECLTCHRAHGTIATMTGFASSAGA
ncbi:MAG: hypothetical protein FDZ75_06345, partial [Actinobacteria bacterium]